ncbi:uncharacterized protein CFP56_017386 [Quercus suber]|uniref:CCHC-type domain-containing protein n=1 Tax=Quercus suber TaxID=58331 RepID=A0AAW0KKL6_QUESU
MADDVVTSMENMKLTTEEEEVITISDEGRLEAIEDCTLSLVGKFLTCKSFNKQAAKNTMRRAWGLEDRLRITEVGPNLFQFKFTSEFDLNRVLRGGPWTFDNQLLLLKRWRRGMTVENIRMETATLWVQIWGAPLDMFTSQVAKEVRSRLGAVEEVEKRRGQDEVHYFMRVRVALPISKPIRRGSFIAGSDGEKHWVKFKYERLPLYCHFCGMLGHDIKNCTEHFAATKNGNTVEYQYGDFLKAMGGRARGGSFERNVGGADYGPEVGGETSGDDSRRSKGGPIRCGAPLHQCREVAAADGLCRNPRNDAEEQSVFSRNKPHIQEHDLAHANYVESTTADVHKAGTELKENTVPVVDGLENTVHSRLEDKAEDSSGMGLGGAEIILEKQADGPNIVKPKSSWTRFNRMDFGLGNLQKRN